MTEPSIIQDKAAAFLAEPATHGEPNGGVEQIETHGAIVFLAGRTAYKMKKAVAYPYMDFSTLAKRRAVCEAELKLNRRTAPDIYRRVFPVRRMDDGTLHLGGEEGEVVEWLLEMRRFDNDCLMSRLAERGALTLHLIDGLADATARLHREAEVRRDMGGAATFRSILDGNEAELARHRNDPFPQASLARLHERSFALFERSAPLLDERRKAGHVRHCHGDLHLDNVVILEGRPTLFDCIEFNEDFACIDTLYDLAFLLMDLQHRGMPAFAGRAFNRYAENLLWAELPAFCRGLELLPLYLSCRAAIRAHTAMRLRDSTDEKDRAQLNARALSYFNHALAFSEPAPPCLMAVGGLSGSGKSTLARTLAHELGRAPGALILRSDVLRKRMAGKTPEEPLPAAAYSAARSEQVYGALTALARTALEAGQTVILDAVFAREHERDAVAALAEELDVPFHGLWLEAAPARMAERLEQRKGDASDATRTVLDRQLGYELGTIRWHRLDASKDAGETAVAARERTGLASRR